MTRLAEAFDTDLATVTAFQDARRAFESFATIGAGELPPDPIDAMQVQLMRWQRERFGDQPDERMALGVIEEISESDLAEDLHEALDALGDTTVYGSQLAMANRLAIRPILELAQAVQEKMATSTGYAEEHPAEILQAVAAQGTLAQVVLKRAQKIRGLDDQDKYCKRLVGSLATCFVRGVMSAVARTNEIIKIADVFLTVGFEVSQRSTGHEAVPKAG